MAETLHINVWRSFEDQSHWIWRIAWAYKQLARETAWQRRQRRNQEASNGEE